MIETIYNIKLENYDIENNEPQVLCLGFFDCVHQGHLRLINRAKQVAFMNNLLTSIFTFSNNPLALFRKEDLILTFKERCFVFEEMQIDYVYHAKMTKEFASIDKTTFLDNLLSKKNVKAIIVGEDYTFGYKKEGDVEYLKAYCKDKGIKVYVESLLKINDKK